jgi:alpha-1,2-mannosyltransferase
LRLSVGQRALERWYVRASEVPTSVIAVAAAVVLFGVFGQGFLWSQHGTHLGFVDLQIYLGAGHNVLFGRNPYDIGYPPIHLDATYPPFGLLIVSPLSLLPVRLVTYLWAVGNVCALTAIVSEGLQDALPGSRFTTDAMRRVAVSALAAGLAFIVLEPVRSDFDFGQINIFLIALVTFDILRRRARARGVLVGVAAAIKLTPLVFVLLLALDRDWRAVRRSIVTFAALVGGSWLIMPGGSAHYFFHLRAESQQIGPPAYISNQSWSGIVARMHITGATSTVLWACLGLLTLAVAGYIAIRILGSGYPVLPALFVMAVAGLLVSPISWTHHWSWVVLAPVVIVCPGVPRVVRAGLCGLTVVAIAAPYWWESLGVLLGPLTPVAGDSLALAGICLLAVWAWSTRQQAESPCPRR